MLAVEAGGGDSGDGGGVTDGDGEGVTDGDGGGVTDGDGGGVTDGDGGIEDDGDADDLGIDGAGRSIDEVPPNEGSVPSKGDQLPEGGESPA